MLLGKPTSVGCLWQYVSLLQHFLFWRSEFSTTTNVVCQHIVSTVVGVIETVVATTTTIKCVHTDCQYFLVIKTVSFVQCLLHPHVYALPKVLCIKILPLILKFSRCVMFHTMRMPFFW